MSAFKFKEASEAADCLYGFSQMFLFLDDPSDPYQESTEAIRNNSNLFFQAMTLISGYLVDELREMIKEEMSKETSQT